MGRKQTWIVFAFISLLAIQVIFSMPPQVIGGGAATVPGLVTDNPTVFLPGQGMQLFYTGGCDGCPSPDALYPGMMLGNDVALKEATSTVYVEETEGGRLAVEDATIFVKIIYGGGSSEFCRIKTDSNGVAILDYESNELCMEQGCTVRFTFCCPDLTEGGCLIPICLGEPSIIAYNNVPPCAGYEVYDGALWPTQALIEGEFVPLYPVIDEFYVPPPTPDFVMGFSFSFCLPVLVIFGLLAAGMFAAGRNPFAAFSFYTPRFKRGSEKMMRGRGMTWNIRGIISTVTSGASSAKGALSSKAPGTAIRESFKSPLSGSGLKEVGAGFKKVPLTSGTGKVPKKDKVVAGAAAPGGGAAGDRVIGRGSAPRMLDAFRGAADSKATGMGKFGVVALGTFTMLSVGMVEKLAQGFYPLYMITQTKMGLGSLSVLMAGAVKRVGAERTVKYCTAGIENLNMQEGARGGKLTLSFVDSEGKKQTLEFANNEEGQRRRAEKVLQLKGEFVIALSIAAPIVREKQRMESEAVAEKISTAQLERAARGEGLLGADTQSILARYDINGDGKLSKTELKEAKAETYGEARALAIMKYDTNGDGAISATEFLRAAGVTSTKPTEVADPAELGMLLLSADRSTLKSLEDAPAGYVQYIKELIRTGTLSNEQFAEASLVLAKLTEAGIVSKTERPSEDVSITKNAQVSELANALAGFQANVLESREGIDGKLGDSRDAALLAVGASSCVSAAKEMGPEGGSLSSFSLRTVAALSETSAPKEGATQETLAEFGGTMKAYGGTSSSANPVNYVAAETAASLARNELESLVAIGAAYETKLGEKAQTITDQINYAATSQGYVTYEQINEMRENSPFALIRKIDDPSTSAEDKANARRTLGEMLEHGRLADNGINPREYDSAATTAAFATQFGMADSVEKYMQSNYGLTPEEYAQVKVRVEAEIEGSLSDPAKAKEAISAYMNNNVGIADSSNLERINSITLDPEGMRAGELRRMQEIVNQEGEASAKSSEEFNKRQEYAAGAREWASGQGDETHADVRQQRIAEEREAIEAEQKKKIEDAHARAGEMESGGAGLSFREWRHRFAGAEPGSFSDYIDYKRERTLMERGEEGDEQRTLENPFYKTADGAMAIRDYKTALDKEFGPAGSSEAPFSREEEKAIYDSQTQRIENLKTQQQALEARYAEPGVDTASLDRRHSELRAERNRIEEQRNLTEQRLAEYREEEKRRRPRKGPNP